MSSINGVPILRESARGCGYRKEGGLYLVGPPPSAPCCVLPVPLPVCPTCQAGIKPARGWTWTQPAELFKNLSPTCATPGSLRVRKEGEQIKIEGAACPMIRMGLGEIQSAGIIWVGEAYYSTPEIFLREARRMGVSRKIGAVPRDFKLGETWVLLAHRSAVPRVLELGREPEFEPGVFSIFKPERIEIVVSPDAAEHEAGVIKGYRDRGLTPVIVEPDEEQMEISG
ncbi:MAG: hypothetical protein R3253_05765 [Longimicrobiales bacterium]|nr:hypothetical protein [Longimicrobiales bacterium]